MHKYLGAVKRVFNNPKYIKLYVDRYWGIIKLYLAYLITLPVKKKLEKKEIWIISEKGTEARDNGYYFYKYIRKVHPEINAFFCITKNSPDIERVQKYKNIVYHNSFKHYMFYLVAKVSASSQPFGAIPEPTGILYNLSSGLRRKDQVVIHLKHGITKDELPHVIDYDKVHFDLICSVSDREREFMMQMHGYPPENILTVGFCRFDTLLLQHNVYKQILIMPTHRMWLHSASSGKKASELECRQFRRSEYFMRYAKLLKNERLIKYVTEKGYKIVFYPHYAIQPFIECFTEVASNHVIIADREHFDVQTLLLESELLITDYSSVFFDFAYMGKPEVFYQFDEEQYRAGHFKKGYFDYYLDAYGKICKSENEVVEEVISILNDGCTMPELYRQRVDSFFKLRDVNNCKRVFEAVYRKAYGE